MLVGLCGGICAGKHSVARYLIQKHGFKLLRLTTEPRRSSQAEASDQLQLPPNSYISEPAAHSFQSADDLVHFVTTRWREQWVITDMSNEALLEKLLLRPFFLLVSVDAPISLRWWRFTDRLLTFEPPDLEKFVLLNDQCQYGQKNGVMYLESRAHVRLFNASSSMQDLYTALDQLDLMNQQRLRPCWDQYFMQLASLAAQRSNCMKRRVGCVLVKNRRVMSTGYNGPRCNLDQGSGTALSTCLCLHAEENALLEAGRERIGDGSVLYCDTVKIAQMGISEVVYSVGYNMDLETAAILNEAGVKLRQFLPPPNNLIDLRDVSKNSDIQESSE
ncbi:Deoxycytidine monophosphate (dCMP) deaminase [Ophidiomyces ophidiicola]|nr:Deoxycytidine monophosphate (dCMP) deaminase [Ophidiomyces ophidiicola]